MPTSTNTKRCSRSMYRMGRVTANHGLIGLGWYESVTEWVSWPLYISSEPISEPKKKSIIESKIQKLEPNVEIKRQKAYKRQEKGWVRSAWGCREKGSAALVLKEFWVMVGYVNIRCGDELVQKRKNRFSEKWNRHSGFHWS